MPKKGIVILPGQVFRRYTVIKELKRKPYTARFLLCRCVCGTTKRVSLYAVTSGKTQSCGCFHKETASKARKTHGMTLTPEYKAWRSMRDRCQNKNDKAYRDYGQRGISVCQEWDKSFQKFFDHVGRRPSSGYSLDRIDNSKGYEPGNVRWATSLEQGRNKRNNVILQVNGVTKKIHEWVEETGIRRDRIYDRLAKGWTPLEAVTIKSGNRSKRK